MKRKPIHQHADDIQAVVRSGFLPLRHCTYWLMRIENVDSARVWLSELLDRRLVKSAADIIAKDEIANNPSKLEKDIAMVGISFIGLRKLDIRESEDFPFPTPFRMGMTHPTRAALIGDADVSDWRWGDRNDGPSSCLEPVDLLVAHYRAQEIVAPDSPFAVDALRESGMSVIRRLDGCPSYIRSEAVDGVEQLRNFEPFGFRDSLAQPSVEGLVPNRDPGERDAGNPDDSIQPGEFVLGHATEYNELSYCPDVQGWQAGKDSASSFGMNGSYLAVRQIWQHVDRFLEFKRQRSRDPTSTNETVRMIGRTTDGSPLLDCPDKPKKPNDFRYRLNDGDGFQCPRGAHMRRANPRDGLGWDVESGVVASKLHRLLRRGRVFRETREVSLHDERAEEPICAGTAPLHCDDPTSRDHCGKGILFIAVNADLERQFELVQKRWLNNTSFADLYDASDPIVGTSKANSFSTPSVPLGACGRSFARFTTVVGGGYFFLPSLTALRFIASRCPQPAAKALQDAEVN